MSWIKTNEACEFLSITQAELKELVKERKIPYYNIGYDLRFRVEELKYWLENKEESMRVYNEKMLDW